VHTTCFNIRRRVQKLVKHKPKAAKRLLKKYSGRERGEGWRPMPQGFKGRFEGDKRTHKQGTSSLCPICGGKLASNGRRLVKCGYENDRDATACINMLRMRGAPFPLKAAHEPVAVRLKG